MNRVLRCTFPFPPQSPPLQVAEACVQCPNAERGVLDQHSLIEIGDGELREAIGGFARWFFHASTTEEERAETIRYAAELYTRDDHTGTCVPKTVLFAYYKGLQFSDDGMPRISEAARGAIRGEPVASWPDGVVRSGQTWAVS